MFRSHQRTSKISEALKPTSYAFLLCIEHLNRVSGWPSDPPILGFSSASSSSKFREPPKDPKDPKVRPPTDGKGEARNELSSIWMQIWPT